MIRDNDFIYPFLGISILKEIADELMQDEESSEVRSFLEEELAKSYYEFDGEDISLFILNIMWLDY